VKNLYPLFFALTAALFASSQTPVPMAVQPNLTYTETFADINNWTNGFVSGTGAERFGSVLVNTTGTIPSGTRITTATSSFVSGSTGGVQKGTTQAPASQSIVLLTTGTTDNTSSTAIDFFMNFSGVSAGTLSFDWASVNNGTGNRNGSLKVYYTIDGTTYTELAAASVSDFTNNVSTTGSVTNVPLPSSFNNSPSARLRFYYHNGTGGTTGSRPKISIDNLKVTATAGGGGDVAAPTVSSFSPVPGADGVATAFTATISFNENIQKSTGNIYLKNTIDGTVVQTIDVASSGVTVTGNVAGFSVASLVNSTGYYFEIDAGAFKDMAGNNFAGITGPSAWNFTTVAPLANGITENTYSFNNCSSYTNEGFQTYNSAGPQVWSCTRFGRTYPGTGVSSDSAIQMSGFAGTAQVNEDWFISPKFNLTGIPIPLLRFYSRTAFAGSGLVLKVSTNYAGSGNPSTATWTDLNGRFPEGASDVWTLSDSINLSPYNTSTNVFIAWVYYSNSTAAARWTLDDIAVYSSTSLPAPNITMQPTFFDFGTINNGTSSAWKAFTFTASDFTGEVTFAASPGFSIAKDSAASASTVLYTAAEINNGTGTLYIRFTPVAANQFFTGNVTATAAGYNKNIIALGGNSYSTGSTLDVVNWNIEWFGATGAGFGPANDSLQEANVKIILRNLNADLYAFSEIVDTMRLRRVADSLGSNYGVAIADYGSYATDVNDPDYGSAQKNGFIYNKNIFTNVTTRGLLRYHAVAQDSIDAAYWFASGRFPYLLNANVTLGGTTKNINFIAIHAKANTGTPAEQVEAYQRRKLGSQALKDTLDANFANANIIFLGDFNDDFDRTIAPTTGADTVSSYQNFIIDSTDANSYISPTLPLSLNGASSTASFPNVIDHVIISNELKPALLSNSAAIRNDVASLVTNYANSTSDHYPVLTRYLIQNNEVPLPVRLVNFTAAKQSESVQVKWSTAT
jgi:hypothetical protein